MKRAQVIILAMKDMNIAKLTSDDLPLFLGITGDLFPDVEVPPVDYEEIIGYITKEAIKLKLQVISPRSLRDPTSELPGPDPHGRILFNRTRIDPRK